MDGSGQFGANWRVSEMLYQSLLSMSLKFDKLLHRAG